MNGRFDRRSGSGSGEWSVLGSAESILARPAALLSIMTFVVGWTAQLRGADERLTDMIKRAILLGGLVGLLSACAAPSGPLALVASTGDQAVTEGQVRVTGDCVHLVSRGEELLLVWPADRASWNAAERSIILAGADGAEMTLTDGMQVRLAGGGWSAAESGDDPPDQVATVTWVAQPEQNCLRDRWWFVSGIAE